jgi:hypothetical protein
MGEAFEGFADAAAVEGGDDEVSGFGGVESGECGFGVADFAEEEDVRALAEGGAEGVGEAAAVLADLALGEEGEVVLEEVFDGVFECDDVAGEVLVELLEAARDGGGFS